MTTPTFKHAKLLLTQVFDLQTINTMNEKKTIYVNGMRAFAPREGAPEFVKASIVITPNDLIQFLKENEAHKSEYNGKTQYRLNLLMGENGPYLTLDTWKPNKSSAVVDNDSLPF